MAINKRKILQSAQKNLQKGAFDKALKDYKTLLEADPKDVNLRLKVGDVYLKQGKGDEAVAAYTKVAERFMKDGFDAKAVALYKQITKIDSKRVDVYVPLAELYQRLGLISDAMGALQTAADAHYREGDKPAALELLRKMATLDPANTTSRLKVAELLRQEGMTPEALAEFEAVAEELERQGEIEGRVSVLQKILELEPDQGKALEGLARAYLVQRKWSQAEEIGLRLTQEAAEFAVEGYEILVEAATGLGREGEIPNLYQAMAQALRERGDDDRARELVQRYCGGSALSADGAELPALESDEDAAAFDAAVGGDGAFGTDELDDPGFVSDAGLRLESPDVERDVVDGRRRASASPEASNRDMPLPPIDSDAVEIDETDTPAPEGDPEQLVAEASVYLRYGKSERAVESLRAALAQEPMHVVALEKLGEALHAGGDEENAIRAWLRGAEAAAGAGDAAAAEALRARVAEVDPSALPPDAASADAPIESEDARETLTDEDDIEIEIDDAAFEDSEEAVDAAPETQAEDATDEPVDEDATDVGLDDELELSEELVADEEPGEAAAAGDSAPHEVEIEVALPSAAGPDLDLSGSELPGDGEELDFAEDEFLTDDPVTDESAQAAADATETPGSDEVGADTSDAAADAEPVFDEALSDELASDEPARDADAEPVFDEALSDALAADETPAAAAADAEPDFDDSLGDAFVTDEPAEDLAASGELDVDVELPVEEPSEDEGTEATAESAETSSSTTPQQIVGELEEGEFYLEQGMLDEAADVYRRILSVAPNHPQAMLRLGEIEARQERASEADDDEVTGELPATAVAGAPAAEAEPAVAEEDSAAAADDDDVADKDDGDFDLAAELSDVFDDGDTGPGTRTGAGTEEEGFEQVFAAFKAGVDKELGDQDHEARYDLGIAYKEMGLLEDAIGEFRVAMRDPERQLQSLHMMGMCALDLARPEDAVSHFEQALAVPGVPEDQQMALRFDLGRAEAARGERERARAAWEAVIAVDPTFQDVGERLEALDRDPPPASDESDASEEAFESFDDLIGEDASESEAAEPAEEYESFDDLIGEDASEDAADEPAFTDAAPSDGADVTEVAEVTAEETSEPVLDADSSAGPQPAEPAGAAEPTAEPVADDPESDDADEPDPDPEPPPRKRRRKKISFM